MEMKKGSSNGGLSGNHRTTGVRPRRPNGDSSVSAIECRSSETGAVLSKNKGSYQMRLDARSRCVNAGNAVSSAVMEVLSFDGMENSHGVVRAIEGARAVTR